ncbi:MAG: hypothetical protein FJ225_01595 [Lentisphaerae bacterium]|nr:hypothetical protein [Lentisphaerota bacterium]
MAFLSGALLAASAASAYEVHNSLSVDYLRPSGPVWERGFGFDAQFGGWFAPRAAFALGVGTLLLRPRPEATVGRAAGALPAEVGPGVTAPGQMPSFLIGPSLWTVIPLGERVSLGAALDGRYAFNPHGPMLYGSRRDGRGNVREYRQRIDVSDGLIARACIQAEAALHASATAFAGVAWEETLRGYTASLQDRPLGQFDVDGLLWRLGFRGNW